MVLLATPLVPTLVEEKAVFSQRRIDNGACLFLAMSSGWDCFGCARADDGG
jgi:hypothetical protein